MRTLAILVCALILSVPALAATPAAAAPGVSPVVLGQFDLVDSMLQAAGLPRGTLRELTAKLDAARSAAVAGNPLTSVNVLDTFLGRLVQVGVPAGLLAETGILRSMVLFEGMFVPIPLVPATADVLPVQLQVLEWFLGDVLLYAPSAMASSCVSLLFPAGGSPAPTLAPESPGPAQPGGGTGGMNGLSPQVKNDLKDMAKDAVKELTGVGGGTSSTGQSGGGVTNGGTQKGNTTVRPRCEVDPGVAGNATSSSGFVSAVTSMGVRVGHTTTVGGVGVNVGVNLDILEPGGRRDLRAGFDLDLTDPLDNWRVSAFGSYDREGGFSFGVGFRLRF